MFRQLRTFLDHQLTELRESDPAADDHALRMATATLLVEMIRADRTVAPAERKKSLASLGKRFGLNDQEARDLLLLAEDEADHAISLHQFTQVLNRQLDHTSKFHMVELLWEVALADGHIDKYEDHLVRKIADLIYVPHHEFTHPTTP